MQIYLVLDKRSDTDGEKSPSPFSSNEHRNENVQVSKTVRRVLKIIFKKL